MFRVGRGLGVLIALSLSLSIFSLPFSFSDILYFNIFYFFPCHVSSAYLFSLSHFLSFSLSHDFIFGTHRRTQTRTHTHSLFLSLSFSLFPTFTGVNVIFLHAFFPFTIASMAIGVLLILVWTAKAWINKARLAGWNHSFRLLFRTSRIFIMHSTVVQSVGLNKYLLPFFLFSLFFRPKINICVVLK